MILNTKYKLGFTLIELLVVVAIIGILAATILASLGSARAKARDARVKSQLSQIRNQMELYFGSHETYLVSGSFLVDCLDGPFASSGGEHNAQQLVQNVTELVCGSSGTCNKILCAAKPGSWAVSAQLSNSSTWCVDSNGSSKEGVDYSGQPTDSPIQSMSSEYRCF